VRVAASLIAPYWRAGVAWFREDCLSHSASVAYYSALSLTPFLVLALAVASFVVDAGVAATHLQTQMAGLVGAEGAELVGSMVIRASMPEERGPAVLVAIVTMAVAATAAIVELQRALDMLLGTRTGPAAAITAVVRVRLIGVAAALSLGFLIVVSLILSAIAAALVTWARPSGAGAWLDVLLNELGSLALVTIAFAGLLRLLPGRRLRVRPLLRGAVTAGVLFEAAKFGIAAYVEASTSIKVYGAAGSVVVLMLWVYYVSGIFLYGALVAREFQPATASSFRMRSRSE